MTKVTVNSGNCDYSASITAEKTAGGKVTISIDTKCEMVMKMLDDISLLDLKSLFVNYLNNPVYRSASVHLKHTACPVPCAVLKAAEVELGLCLPENIEVKFIKD
jgi:hypothetical protein